MSVPEGPIWQWLRQRALDAVPLGSQFDFKVPPTLRHWQKMGSYVVEARVTKGFDLAAFTNELGGVLLAECEQFLDHAAEHQVTILQQIRSGVWTSAAWQVVTVYYWAYYALLALTRLLGDSVWFIDTTVANHLTTLAPGTGARIGAGAFRVTCGSALSATQRTLQLRKLSGRSHDGLWRLWSGLVDEVFVTSRPLSGSSEERVFATMRRAVAILGPEWPSDLRNVINYRPGFAYRSVRSASLSSALRNVRDSPPYKFDELLATFESGVASLDSQLDVAEQLEVAVKVLASYTFVIHALSCAVHAEIVDRTGIDKRWLRSRASFLNRHTVGTRDGTWPCA